MLAMITSKAKETWSGAHPMIVPKTPPAYAADIYAVLNPYSVV
jgi:hypothetical protein